MRGTTRAQESATPPARAAYRRFGGASACPAGETGQVLSVLVDLVTEGARWGCAALQMGGVRVKVAHFSHGRGELKARGCRVEVLSTASPRPGLMPPWQARFSLWRRGGGIRTRTCKDQCINRLRVRFFHCNHIVTETALLAGLPGLSMKVFCRRVDVLLSRSEVLVADPFLDHTRVSAPPVQSM